MGLLLYTSCVLLFLAGEKPPEVSVTSSVTCDPSRRPLHPLHPGLAQPGLAAAARLVRRGQAGGVHALGPLQRAGHRQRGGLPGGGGIILHLSFVPLTSQSSREFGDDAAVGLCIKCACNNKGGEGKTPGLVFLKHFLCIGHCISNL